MENGLFDLLWVFLILGISLLNAFRKKKTQIPQDYTVPEEETPADDRPGGWQQLFDELKESTFDVKELFTEPADFQPQMPERPASPVTVQETVHTAPKNPVVTHRPITHTFADSDQSASLMKPEEKERFLPDFSDRDELKRAVIYSEILNRKYN